MKIYLFSHDGSGNHGCEAIVRSTAKMLRGAEIHLLSTRPEEDRNYSLAQLVTISDRPKLNKLSPEFLFAYIKLKLMRDGMALDEISAIKTPMSVIKNADVSMAIGGDVYCYGSEAAQAKRHTIAKRCSKKTVFWGCSIEPELLQKPEVAADIARFDLITARESISYEALKAVNSNTILVADPAFQLDKVDLPLPEGFAPGNTVGINVSPLAANAGNLVYENYSKLIAYIIENTDMQVMLTPHVVWAFNNDLDVLTKLYEAYRETGRVILLGDHNCEELKGYISRCRFFVGARTHATIAAYSTCVPTLVSGYSVKARGIARDIFGTEENYVIPVQNMTNDTDLTCAFKWLMENESKIRTHLEAFMPEYCKRSLLAADAVYALFEDKK